MPKGYIHYRKDFWGHMLQIHGKFIGNGKLGYERKINVDQMVVR